MKPLCVIALTLLAAGCASHSGDSSVPRPGKGIAEYREVVQLAHRAVAAAVDSLGPLKSVSAQDARELARFDRAMDNLELTSVKARARAEAIIARGQSYFDEWKEQLAGKTNQPSAQANYDRLYNHFTNVRQRSSEVREEFRPFMAKLRQFRAQFDRPSNSGSSPGQIETLTASGQRVLKALESVSTALNDAEAELHAIRKSKQ